MGEETYAYSVLTASWALRAFLMDTLGEILKPATLALVGGLWQGVVLRTHPAPLPAFLHL